MVQVAIIHGRLCVRCQRQEQVPAANSLVPPPRSIPSVLSAPRGKVNRCSSWATCSNGKDRKPPSRSSTIDWPSSNLRTEWPSATIRTNCSFRPTSIRTEPPILKFVPAPNVSNSFPSPPTNASRMQNRGPAQSAESRPRGRLSRRAVPPRSPS